MAKAVSLDWLDFQPHSLLVKPRKDIIMSLDDKAFQKGMDNKNIVENYCRTYISSKNQSVDEITIHNMVSALSDYLYVTISQDTVNKEFVSRFSTPTGNKCKDGQIEVICMFLKKNCKV